MTSTYSPQGGYPPPYGLNPQAVGQPRDRCETDGIRSTAVAAIVL